jgi:hypothetical protein
MRTRLWAAALAALTLAGTAHAQPIGVPLTMRFGVGGLPNPIPNPAVPLQFTAAPGGTVTFQVFIADADTYLRDPAQGNGLLNAGVGVHSSNTAVADFVSTSDLAANSEFAGFPPIFHVNDAQLTSAATTAGLPNPSSGNASIQNAAFPTRVPVHQQTTPPTTATPDYLLVGTFTIHIPATATPGSTTTLTPFDWQPGAPPTGSLGNNFSGISTGGSTGNLDQTVTFAADSARITVTGVPEPSTVALAGLAAVGLAARRRRRQAPAAAA